MHLSIQRIFSSIRARITISILLLAGVSGGIAFASLKPAPTETVAIAEAVTDYFHKHQMPHGFYFENLATHEYMDIGGDEPFLASSLLKLPFVMNLYKAAEKNLVNLDEQVEILPENRDPRFGNLARSKRTSISLRQAAQLTLTESDNTALAVIKQHLPTYLTDESSVIRQLNSDITIRDNQWYITAQSNTQIFVCLYDDCFNQRADSQEILKYLAQSRFPGIADGVPKSIKVAHKIGTTSRIHNDCGIVYAPGHPYVLCLMIDQPEQTYARVMKEVSEIVYKQVAHSR